MTTIYDLLRHVTEIDPSRVAGLDGKSFLMDLTGEGGGKWTLRVEGDRVLLEEGETAPPDVTLTMEAQDFIRLSTGELNPVAAFMQGKIKIGGDMTLAMRLQTILT